MSDPPRPPSPIPQPNTQPISNTQPPPLPPRVPPTTAMGPYGQSDMYGGTGTTSYGGMGMGMSNYGMSPYGASSYGSGYGSYGSGYGSYGSNQYGSYGSNQYGSSGYGTGGHMMRGGESDFVRIAEERSRGALQNVETIVTAFGSISMMLESTLNAFYSSFRAILGVADHFGRLRMQLGGILETLAAFRLLKWLLNRLMILLRMKSVADANADSAWSNAAHGDPLAGLGGGGGPKPTNWTSIMITGIALAGPWLIYRLIQTIVKGVEESRKWAKGEAEFYDAKVLYEFMAQGQQELSVKLGEQIRVAPKEEQPNVRGWVLAADLTGERIGLVPNNYIQIVGRRNISTERSYSAAYNTEYGSRSSSAGRLSD